MFKNSLKIIIVFLLIFGFINFSCDSINSYERIKNSAISSAINTSNIYLSQSLKNGLEVRELVREKDTDFMLNVTKFFFENISKFHNKDSIENSMASFRIYDLQQNLLIKLEDQSVEIHPFNSLMPSYLNSKDSLKNAIHFESGFFADLISKIAMPEKEVNGFNIAKTGMVFSRIVPNAKKNGKEFYAVDVLVPIHDNAGFQLGFMQFIYDVDEQFQIVKNSHYFNVGIFVLLFFLMSIVDSHARRVANLIIESQHELNRKISDAKEKIEQESREKSEFLANFTHELRTPLNAIIGFSEILKTEALGPIENKQYVEQGADIHASGSHLLSLINDILDYSKAAANKLNVEKEEMDLNKIVLISMKLVKPRADQGKVNLIQNLPQEHVVILADQKRMKQVMLNLLSNAVKFTPEGGSVTVTVTQNPEFIEIQVQDTGIGMIEKDISKALSSFGQLDSKPNRKYEGTGLGLPLTKKLVELMGGQFGIKSEQGVGTKITLKFYITSPSAH